MRLGAAGPLNFPTPSITGKGRCEVQIYLKSSALTARCLALNGIFVLPKLIQEVEPAIGEDLKRKLSKYKK
ncbi:MAG: hypothetical protein GY794_01545 [bacterium]|nr:hypothetical protein [bacterium]